MALNPFEQLESFVSEPRKAFEDLATMLLQDCGKAVGRVAIYLGDGGVDAYTGDFSRSGQLRVYQTKYFTRPWSGSQKQQIRTSFETAANSQDFNLKEWVLCVPVRVTRQDLKWFDGWKAEQSVIEGNKVKITDRIELYKGKPEIRIDAAALLQVE
jgi:hypothetical protein